MQRVVSFLPGIMAIACIGNRFLFVLQLMLSSDEGAFGGFENLSKKYDTEFPSTAADYDGRPHSIKVGGHSRSLFVPMTT